MCILGGISGFVYRSVAFESTFGHSGSLYYFMLAWIVLFDPPLYMGMAMLNGAQKYIGILFRHGI